MWLILLEPYDNHSWSNDSADEESKIFPVIVILMLDLWLAKDNRFLNPKSSYERIPTVGEIGREKVLDGIEKIFSVNSKICGLMSLQLWE